LMMKSPLKHKFLKFVNRHRLIRPNERVLVAVSGGMDSMALLHLLLEWQSYFQLDIAVVHLNHQLRGEESDEEEAFVVSHCQQLNIPIHTRRIPVREVAREQRLSLEEAGHLLRYQVFEELLTSLNFNKLATAHHQNDLAETILMRILKGTGISGLSGINLKKNNKIIRPLLFATREEIKQYIKVRDIPYIEDPSNRDLRYLRNKIRHQLIPYLKQEFHLKNFDQFLSLSLIVQEWLQYVNSELCEIKKQLIKSSDRSEISLELNSFKSYFSWIQKEIIEFIIKDLISRDIILSYSKFSDFQEWINRPRVDKPFSLHRNILAIREGNRLRIRNLGERKESIKQKIFPGRWYILPTFRLRIRMDIVAKVPEKLGVEKGVEYIAADGIRFPLTLRKWKAGDRFHPLGMKNSKLISDFLTDIKIKLPYRKEVLVLESGGEIVAVLGQRISEQYKITERTQKILKIIVERI